MPNHGPNVTKLILRVLPIVVIPNGSGIAGATKFFQDPNHRKAMLDEAEKQAMQMVQMIKTASNNPYGDDEEKIAAAIVEEIDKKRKTFSSTT